MALLKLVVSFPGFAFPAPYRADSIVQRVQESKRCAPNAVALVQVGSVNRALLAAGRVPTHAMVDVADSGHAMHLLKFRTRCLVSRN